MTYIATTDILTMRKILENTERPIRFYHSVRLYGQVFSLRAAEKYNFMASFRSMPQGGTPSFVTGVSWCQTEQEVSLISKKMLEAGFVTDVTRCFVTELS